MEFIKKYLSYADFFGYDLNFRNNQFKKYKTFYGGLLTVICIGFFIYSFLNLAADCFNKTNPIVRESNYFADYSVVEGKEFFFSFYFTDENFNIIDQPEKYLIFHGVITNYTNHRQTRKIPFIKCDYKRHFHKTKLEMEKINEKITNFNETWCLDLDNDFHLTNSLNEIPRHSLSIYVIECSNSTILDMNCKFIYLSHNKYFPIKKYCL